MVLALCGPGNVSAFTTLIGGELLKVPRLSDTEEITFPEPIGKCEAYTTGGLINVTDHLELDRAKDAWVKTVR